MRAITNVFKGLIVLALALGLAGQARAYDTQTNRVNRVRVDVKPIQLAQGQAIKFRIFLNTHRGDLSQDLAAVSGLTDDRGQEYKPARWTGSPPGGHHRFGVLEFPALKAGAKSVTLVIKNIAGVPARKFAWRVE